MYAIQLNDPPTLDTEVRHLPSVAQSRLGQIMEVNHIWQEIMGLIPAPPWIPGQPIPNGNIIARKYTNEEIRLLSDDCSRHSRTGFEALIDEWGTSGRVRPKIQDLVNLLKCVKLDRAVHYIYSAVLRVPTDSVDTTGSTITSDPSLHSSVYDSKNNSITSLINDIRDTEELELSIAMSHQNSITRVIDDINDIAELDLCIANNNNNNNGNNNNSNSNGEPLPLQSASSDERVQPDNEEKTPTWIADCKVPHFDYDYLRTITNMFSEVPIERGGHKLGEGAFGVVYKARIVMENNVIDTKDVAVKCLSVIQNKIDDQFMSELLYLSKCDHVNVLQLVGHSNDGPHLCLLYTYMCNGSLQDRLNQAGGTPSLSWQCRVSIGKGVGLGIHYLHTAFLPHTLVHRDIKTANVLLDESFVPKVGDFGLVRQGGSGLHTRTAVQATTVIGTSAYMAPEAFRGDVSAKMDVFSYAIVLLELLTGLPSFDMEREERSLLSHYEEKDEDPMCLLDCSAGEWNTDIAQTLFQLVNQCIVEKKKRPIMSKVLQVYDALPNYL